MSWRNDLALIAGADLSSQQYKFVGPTGVLATYGGSGTGQTVVDLFGGPSYIAL